MKFLRWFFLVVLLSSLSYLSLFAQNRTDGEFLFKVWLYIEHQNDHARDIPSTAIKDSSLFQVFNDNIRLIVDTLKSNGYFRNYVFLRLKGIKSYEDQSPGGISYKNKKSTLLIHRAIPIICDGYVLCVNKLQGTSFRLQGFEGNDLLSLINEIRDVSTLPPPTKSIEVKEIIKNLVVEGIDFNCIYKGLTDGKGDSEKFPCLKPCSYITITVH